MQGYSQHTLGFGKFDQLLSIVSTFASRAVVLLLERFPKNVEN